MISTNTIYTIGHSTRTLEHFVDMLKSFEVELLVDIRHFPGSRKYPHFNKDSLQVSIPKYGIEYRHLIDLGGRRKANVDSKNSVWRHPAFRGYADYMETSEFKDSAAGLEKLARHKTTAIMCSEAVWWRCHRSMVADYLKANGWTVMHIMETGSAKEHPYTAPAKVVGGSLTYEE